MSGEIKVHVNDRKYTFSIRDLHIVIDRYGEPWHQQQDAFNALCSIMYELDAARVVLEACRVLGDDAPKLIKDALAKHRNLVGDTEKPSPWSV